jgi:hypothetical protein
LGATSIGGPRPGVHRGRPRMALAGLLGLNLDKVPASERYVSTSNRNFVGLQGPASALTSLARPWPRRPRWRGGLPTCWN